MTKPPRSKPLLRETEAPIRSRPCRKRNPAQSQLLFDPMPDRVEPTLAQLSLLLWNFKLQNVIRLLELARKNSPDFR